MHVQNSVVYLFGWLIVILSVIWEAFNISQFTIVIKCERVHMKVYIYIK